MTTIRPWTLNDVATLQRLADDAQVARFMSGFPYPYTIEEAQRWLNEAVRHDPAQFFAIEYDGVVVGGGAIEPAKGSRHGVALVGYWLTPSVWGRGIATQAVKLFAERAFDEGYRRLQAHVFAPNTASVRVLEKCGFALEARLRDSYVQRDGTPCDELIFRLVRQTLFS